MLHSNGSGVVGRLVASVVGLLMVLGAGWLLFWNEGRAVKTQQALEEGRDAVVTLLTVEKELEANEGCLVHALGTARTEESVREPLFGFEVPCLRLVRQVEYYQWVERKDKRHTQQGDGSAKMQTHYHYTQRWVDRPVNSRMFRETHHRNTVALDLPSDSCWGAKRVHMGAFLLHAGQVSRAGEVAELSAAQVQLPPEWAARGAWSGNAFYIGCNGPADADNPQIGDVRITWSAAPQQAQITLVAQQRGHAFVPYVAKSGYTVDLLRNGSYTAAEMFEHAMQQNQILCWVLRGVGVLLMLVGMCMALLVLRGLVGWIPLLGGLLEGGVILVGLAAGVLVSLVIIASAWFFYRPLLAAGLIFFGVIPVYYLISRSRRNSLRASGKFSENRI